MKDGAGRRIMRWVVEHNCLYLLSVFCLLIGVWSVIDSAKGLLPLGSELSLLGLFVGYEFLLLGVAWFVYRRFRKGHDGLMLACIAVLLLFDPTFFNNVFYARGLKVGVLVNGLCFLLAVVKVGFLVRVVGIPIHRRTVGMVVLAAGIVFLAPAIFVDKRLTERLFSLSWLWWLLPLLVIVGPSPMRKGKDRHHIPTDDDAKKKFPLFIFAIPMAALFVHFWQIAQVYDLVSPLFTWSPVVLTGAILCVRCNRHFFLEQRWLLHSALLGSLFLSIESPQWSYLQAGDFVLTPWRFSLLAGAALAYMLWNSSGFRDLAVAAGVQTVIFVLGATPKAVIDALLTGDAMAMTLCGSAFLWACYRWRHPLLLGAAAGSAVAAVGRLLGMHDDLILFVAFQAAGIVSLIAIEVRDGKLKDSWKMLPSVLLGISFAVSASSARGLPASLRIWATAIFWLEGSAFVVMALWRHDLSYAVPVTLVAFAQWGEDLLNLLRRNFGVTCLTLAFGSLFAGMGVSACKDEVLESLVTPEETG